MARIYKGSFISITNVEYRVELWDDPTGTTPEIVSRLYNARVQSSGGYQEGQSCLLEKLNALNSTTELTLAGEGVSIQRESEGDSVYQNFVRQSRAIANWVIPTQTIMDDFIGIQTKAETAWSMLVYRDDSLIYVGRVLADQMTRLRESIESKPIIDLVAVDGFELMSGFNVKSSWFTDGKITISQLFRRCLESFDLSEYWVVNGTNQAYLFDGTLLREASALRLGFDMYKIDEYTFLQDFDPFTDVKVFDSYGWQVEPNYIDCKQALENVLLMFGARLTHERGAYYVIPFNAYDNTTTINLRQYSYTGQYIGTTTYSHRQTIGNDVRPLWIAKPSLYYQPAAQSVTVNTHRQNLAIASRTYPNLTTSTLSLVANDIPTGSTPDDAPIRIRLMAKSFKRSETIGGVLYTEDSTDVYYNIRLVNPTTSATRVLDANGYWVSGGLVNVINRQPTKDIKGGWITSEFELSVTTAPAGFTRLEVNMFVHGNILNYSGTGKWKNGNSAVKDFWGTIQVAFADESPYQNADYVFDKTEVITASTANLVNSTPIVIESPYYTDNLKYAVGNWLVNNGTTDVLASDWYGGWDSITHGTITKMLGLQMASIYANFVPVIRGTWIDSGSLTAIKTLYFDNYAWVLNGVQWNARSEQWDGEWIGVSPVYTSTTSTGEGLKVQQTQTGGLSERLNYIESAVSNLNSAVSVIPELVLEDLINNAEGAPTSQPTLNTRWEVMLEYVDSSELVRWHVQEHNASVTYTAGTHTITNGYELIIGDSTDGNVIVNLPNATESKGKKYYFKKIANPHTLTISGNGYNIDANGTKVLNQNYETCTVISNGVQWYLV
jgi:hypothetical protein